MTILSLHKLTFLAALALLGLSVTSPVSAAPILSPRLIHAGTSDLSPGSAFFPSSQSTLSPLSRRNSKLHRREETGVIQGGGNASVKLEVHPKGILGLEVEANSKVGGGNKSKKHSGSKSKTHVGNKSKTLVGNKSKTLVGNKSKTLVGNKSRTHGGNQEKRKKRH